ncbi:MAG: zinc-binding alcohol dehydrogenase family protein [Abitibacteriaceae bacterium]|nr:zinc-binding alcohol dehydrogenase family protein [Abditibacteriaceae bacterium]
MRTITLNKPGEFSFGETETPGELAPDTALVRVHRVGICGTDLHAFRGRQPFFSYPRILGHELGVEIIEVGANEQGLKVGDHCAVEPYLNCGHCIACRRGKPNCCVNLQVLGVHTDGGMRELIHVPVHKLHPSQSLSLDQLALVETLGIGAHAVARAQLQAGEFVLVIGAGPIGLSVIQFAQLEDVKIIVLDVSESRLEFCQQQLDVEFTMQGNEDVLNRLQELTNGDLPTVVFDATGNATSMGQAFNYVAHGGKLIFVGLVQADITFNDPNFHRRELTLFATRNSTGADFQRIISLLENGRVSTEPWITHRATCEAMIEQFPQWLEPDSGVIKALVEF